MFTPYTTLYICTGTGLDMANSAWFHRFAYSTSTVEKDNSWWNTAFQWVKAHSIAEGYWYLTNIRPELGYVDVGRTTLQKNKTWGEAGLGNTEKQAELDNPNIPYAEALTGADYLVFANDASWNNGDTTWNADTKYAFINRIDNLNQNTARVWFTIDAIMTYQKFFTLGRCFVLNDMQFQERTESESGAINVNQINWQPESIQPSDEQYVFQQFSGQTEGMQALDLGAYNKLFVTSDISLTEEDIQPNPFYSGLIGPKPAKSSQVTATTQLGIGGYFVPERINAAFTKLGSFNAFEHLLYSYIVPQKLVEGGSTALNATGEPQFIDNFQSITNTKYTGSSYEYATPNGFDDNPQIIIADGATSAGYKPVNTKTLFAPYNYFSITDKQGNSVEIMPQVLDMTLSTPSNWLTFRLHLDLSPAPNVLSTLSVPNLKQALGSQTQPLQTLWQVPTYTMTPNNSGYNNFLPQAIANGIMGTANVAVGSSMSVGASLAPGIGAALGSAVPGVGNAVGAAVGSLVAQPLSGLGSSYSSAGANQQIQVQQAMADYAINRIYGLPKAMGGTPSGMSLFNMNNAGYRIFRVHLKTDLLKLIDYRFSIVGYTQNVFRYPHINIRRRWCFVKLGSVNIVPIPANNYDSGGIPFEMREQIESRLKAGVTFWNLRQAVTGGNDMGTSSVQSWTDSGIQNNKFCKFVRNYGTGPDSDIVKENASFTGGYANDYTDDYEQEL